MSVPPSCVSPDVLITSNTPPPISMTVTSRVPPPKSKTIIFMSCFDLSKPKASDAAVGSLIMRTTSRPAMVPASFVAWRWLSSKYAGTVMTAFSTLSPVNASASFLIFCSMKADICCGLYCLPPAENSWSVPILRLAATMVLSGLVTAWRLAGSPTKRSPSFEKATIEGNALPPTEVPSAADMIEGLPPIITAAAELLVPRSMPITLAIVIHPW